jgi:nitrous oxide reductase accessory protein NosL
MVFAKDDETTKITIRDFISLITVAVCLCGFSIFPATVLADDSMSGPKPGLLPLDERGTMQISDRDRCPVCAMWVVRYREFAAAIQLKDGKTFYFCSNGCMLRSWMQPEIFLGVAKAELKRSVVQDYFTGEQVSGRSVHWISGSDVIGPMGPALVPLKDEQYVEVFKKRHGAKEIFRLSEMTDEKWQQLTGN